MQVWNDISKSFFTASELNEHEAKTEETKQHKEKQYIIEYYKLDLIISLSFRISTPPSKAFRRWITEQVV